MSILIGPVDWNLSMDSDGHRTYEITWLVEAENVDQNNIDDPSEMMRVPGLPTIGSSWSSLSWITGYDDWAFCVPDLEVSPYDVQQGEAPLYYHVKQKFSTRPLRRCQDRQIENPLNEPPDISGSWVAKRVAPRVDRDGLPYCYLGELIMGPDTEIDDNDWEVKIEFNSAFLPLSLINSLRHSVNSAPLWGLPAGCVKFSSYSFSRRLYGRCGYYYRHSMGFQIRSSWTQYIQAKTRMKLISGGDATDPDDYVLATDLVGNNIGVVPVATDGKPLVDASQTPAYLTRNPYPLGNLLLLGIPASL